MRVMMMDNMNLEKLQSEIENYLTGLDMVRSYIKTSVDTIKDPERLRSTLSQQIQFVRTLNLSLHGRLWRNDLKARAALAGKKRK